LRRLYREAAVYAHPALYEPFGLTVLEAALSGCALVLADIPTLRELWGPVATFVPPRDEAALATAVRRFQIQPETAKAAALRSRHYALRYSAEAMTGRYLDVYRELAGAAPDRSLATSTTRGPSPHDEGRRHEVPALLSLPGV
jgi:glycosyltransferase involved in cell wall biosynthesis